jgi:hypothetical protein
MIGGASTAWSATSGVHTFMVCQAVARRPVGQPQVVTAQIHDAHYAVLLIRRSSCDGQQPGQPASPGIEQFGGDSKLPA